MEKNHMLRELDPRIFKEEKSSTKRMEYHTEKIVTLRVHPSMYLAIVMIGIFSMGFALSLH